MIRDMQKQTACPAMFLAMAFALSGCGPDVPTAAPTPQTSAQKGDPMRGFTLSSPAFSEGATIPRQYTCDGQGMSPPLQWTIPPPGTQSLALVVEDPDAPAGTFIHWV